MPEIIFANIGMNYFVNTRDFFNVSPKRMIIPTFMLLYTGHTNPRCYQGKFQLDQVWIRPT